MENIKKHERVDAADMLRGFAVMGIILLHFIEHFNFYSFPDPATQPTWLNFIDKCVWDGLFFMFGGKAYAIFALLFGFSFFIQHDNQRMRGSDFRVRFCWRLLLLFIIGNLNACFFTGEILVLYSIVGLVLVATCRLTTRALWWLIGLCMLQPVCVYQIARALIDPAYEPLAIEWGPWWSAANEAQTSASLAEMVRVNLWEGQLFSLGWAWDAGRFMQTAALFMAGMLIGRQGWFLRQNLSKWGVVLAVALACYFPISGLDAMVDSYITASNILTPLHTILSSLYKVSFMLVIVSGLLFAYYCTGRLSRWLSLLIPYGKMSMTNYVTQGIVGSFIFYHWGLHAHLNITLSFLLGIAMFLLQYAFCRFWVGRHGHGPLEYVWKKATWIW